MKNELKNAVLCHEVTESSIVLEDLSKYRGKVVLLYDNEDFAGYN